MNKKMKSSYANDYKRGDKVITYAGFVGVVKNIIASRYVVVDFENKNRIERRVYIPAHGEIKLIK